jgi:hypothetical protein
MRGLQSAKSVKSVIWHYPLRVCAPTGFIVHEKRCLGGFMSTMRNHGLHGLHGPSPTLEDSE